MHLINSNIGAYLDNSKPSLSRLHTAFFLVVEKVILAQRWIKVRLHFAIFACSPEHQSEGYSSGH